MIRIIIFIFNEDMGL